MFAPLPCSSATWQFPRRIRSLPPCCALSAAARPWPSKTSGISSPRTSNSARTTAPSSSTGRARRPGSATGRPRADPARAPRARRAALQGGHADHAGRARGSGRRPDSALRHQGRDVGRPVSCPRRGFGRSRGGAGWRRIDGCGQAQRGGHGRPIGGPDLGGEEELPGRRRISAGGEENVDRLAMLVDGAIEVMPDAGDPDVALIHVPPPAHRLAPVSGGVDEERGESLHPPVDGDVVDGDAPLFLLRLYTVRILSHLRLHSGSVCYPIPPDTR
jgi:hypothetical protein